MPLGRQQPKSCSLALEQRIGCNRGALNDAIGRAKECGAIDSQRCGKQVQPGEHADRLIPGRGGRFRGSDPSTVVDGDKVGEGAAYVDADSVPSYRRHGFTRLDSGELRIHRLLADTSTRR